MYGLEAKQTIAPVCKHYLCLLACLKEYKYPQLIRNQNLMPTFSSFEQAEQPHNVVESHSKTWQ